MTSETLLELASAKFGPLSDAEQRLFRGVADGRFPDFSAPNAAENDPATADEWPATRVLAADRISWLLTDRVASTFVTHRGLGIKGARIEGRLDLQAANLVFAIYFERCALAQGVNLLGAELFGVNFSGSHVGRITADGIKVEGSVSLRAGCRVLGRARFIGAQIGGNLDCQDGQFLGGDGETLSFDSARIEGSVLLNQRCRVQGTVRMLGAQIRGNLSCDAGEFVNPTGDAILGDRLRVEGNVFLCDGFRAVGRVALPSSSVTGVFVWRTVANPEEIKLDLRSAQLGSLVFSRDSWPQPGKLLLYGLKYELLDDLQNSDTATWIAWLRRQPERPFRPQPYEQLAAVLRRDGLDGDAKDVQYAKECDRARRCDLTWSQLPWYRFFGPMIGYGFRPWRAFWLSLAVVVVGAMLFGAGHRYQLMTPVKAEGYITDNTGKQRLSENYPQLAPFMYSLDVFTPLINLDQGDFWLPAANRGRELNFGPVTMTTGELLRVYLWFHIIAGWTLSTLLFVGLSGSVPGA